MSIVVNSTVCLLQAVKMVARYMFWEVIDEMVHTLATVVVHTCRFHNVLQMDVFNAIVSDVSSCFIRCLYIYMCSYYLIFHVIHIVKIFVYRCFTG